MSVLRQARNLTEEASSEAVCVWFNAWQYDHEAYPPSLLALEIAALSTLYGSCFRGTHRRRFEGVPRPRQPSPERDSQRRTRDCNTLGQSRSAVLRTSRSPGYFGPSTLLTTAWSIPD